MKHQREVTITLDCDREFLEILTEEIQKILHEANIPAWAIHIDEFHNQRPLMGDKGGFIDKFEEKMKIGKFQP